MAKRAVTVAAPTHDLRAKLQIRPLGGCGEIGLNATLFRLGGKAILVDCGVLLGVERSAGVEKARPSFSWLNAEGQTLDAVFLTHGHEDHVGALGHLLGRCPVPVYGTAFTLAVVKMRLESAGFDPSAADLRMVDFGDSVSVGPFSVEWIRVAHSIPDSAALLIKTPAGRVLHSGDFRMDLKAPVPTDAERLRAVGDEGVDLLLSDSTNSERTGHQPSEVEVHDALEGLVKQAPGRVVVAMFASHVYRMRALIEVARRQGRRVALVGRSLENMYKLALDSGWVEDDSLLVPSDRLHKLAPHEALVLATGTQGELNAGLLRLISGGLPKVKLGASDRIVLSARTIPGNELAVRGLVNQIAKTGAELVKSNEALVHCSGHAGTEEQVSLLELLRPRAFIPLHGDRVMLEAHARTAAQSGVPQQQVVVLVNGESALLSKEGLSRGPRMLLEPVPLDSRSREISEPAVRARRRMGRNGMVVVAQAKDGESEAEVTFKGVSGSEAMHQALAQALQETVGAGARTQDDLWFELRRVLRRFQVEPELVVTHASSDPASGA